MIKQSLAKGWKRFLRNAVIDKLRVSHPSIGYLGHSVTAQKNGYRQVLHEMLVIEIGKPIASVNASLGGVGSIVSTCLIDKFLSGKAPTLCFVETTVADSGGATPKNLIAPSMEGLIRKLLKKGTIPIVLHLPRGDIPAEHVTETRNQVDEVANHYQVPVITLPSQPCEGWTSDGIHTTQLGGLKYAEYIFGELRKSELLRTPQSLKRLTILDFEYSGITNSELRVQAKRFSQERMGLFRGMASYLSIHAQEFVEIEYSEQDVLGVMIIADNQSPVVELRTRSQSVSVQIHDEFCAIPRIQVILPKILQEGKGKLTILATGKSGGDYDCQGRESSITHVGQELKLVGVLRRIASSQIEDWIW